MQSVVVDIADISDYGALSDSIGARVDINPEALACGVDVELGDAPVSERSRASEGVREDELVRGRGTGASLERGRDFGSPHCRHNPYHGHHHDALDHGEASPVCRRHTDTTPHGRTAYCCACRKRLFLSRETSPAHVSASW